MVKFIFKFLGGVEIKVHSAHPEQEGVLTFLVVSALIGDLDVVGDALLFVSGIATASFPDPDIVNTSTSGPLLNTINALPTRWRCIALGATCQFLDSHACLGDDQSSLQTALVAVHPSAGCTIQTACKKDEFQPTNVIDLLNSTKWPEGNDLELAPLPEILYALCIVHKPKVDNPANHYDNLVDDDNDDDMEI
ncbi:hypothetical protein M405DRAFT_890188 [Rhizopogon salebrosus TDB-379]|nr:hypothetical protein M405DRAFT_890188 [Rhizopogon salebrosus TDB-379]